LLNKFGKINFVLDQTFNFNDFLCWDQNEVSNTPSYLKFSKKFIFRPPKNCYRNTTGNVWLKITTCDEIEKKTWLALKINGYWSIKATRSQWAVWIWIWQRDNWSGNRLAAVHAREARQSHRQGIEFQNKFQISDNERCNEYCEKRISYFRSRRQTWIVLETARKFGLPWQSLPFHKEALSQKVKNKKSLTLSGHFNVNKNLLNSLKHHSKCSSISEK
jgi:hypothetical protein